MPVPASGQKALRDASRFSANAAPPCFTFFFFYITIKKEKRKEELL